jgi:hypothetical protein
VRQLRTTARRSSSTAATLQWLPAVAAISCSNGVERGRVRCGPVEQRGRRGWNSSKWRKATTTSLEMCQGSVEAWSPGGCEAEGRGGCSCELLMRRSGAGEGKGAQWRSAFFEGVGSMEQWGGVLAHATWWEKKGEHRPEADGGGRQ